VSKTGRRANVAEYQADEITLASEWVGKGKGEVAVRVGDEVVFTDLLNPSSVLGRKRFVKELLAKIPQAIPTVIDTELLRIVDRRAKDEAAPGPANSGVVDSAALLRQMPQDIRDEAEAMLHNPQLIKRILEDVALLNVAGERELVATVYLTGVSRLLPRPLSTIVKGPSSSGKSYLIDKTATLFPPETLILATQMTPQALFHMKPGSLIHKFVVAGERSRLEDDERAEATRALREMQSAGRLTKLMPVKMAGGHIESVQIEQDGPIAYIESTTLTKIFDEDANRCILMDTDERPEQTRRILKQLATGYAQANGTAVKDRIVSRHHALQRMLHPLPIVIPYAESLGELFTAERVEARRAFPQLVSMIQAVALLHQKQREQDADGHLIATAEDYQLARRLADECAFARLADLRRDALERWLAARTDEGMAAKTRNIYRGALVNFCNWCVANDRLASNPFDPVAVANVKADRRRVHRAMTEVELVNLLAVARERPLIEATTVRKGPRRGERYADVRPEVRDRLDMLGRERALIYKTLVLTGLRKGELSSLTVAHLHLDDSAPYADLDAADEKNREGSAIALRDDLAADLRSWLADKLQRLQSEARGIDEAIPARLPPDTPLFDVPTGILRIFDRDLKKAGIPKKDERGRSLDVHAMRTTFGTLMSKGGVSPRTAQAAMRHSDIRLTMNVYTDPKLLDICGALDTLPTLRLDGANRDRATGTTGEALRTLAPTLAPTLYNLVQAESSPVKTAGGGRHTEQKSKIAVSGNPDKRKGPLSSADSEPSKSGQAALHLCGRNHRVAVGAVPLAANP
jgi:integrase